MSSGELTSLFSYVMSLLMSLMMLSMVIVMISMSMASVRRISQVLREEPDLKEPENPVYQVENGGIDFEHVTFSYKHGSGKNALTDIDLHIRPGETIGVIGGTGSGKSSLVNLSAGCTMWTKASCGLAAWTCATTIWKRCEIRFLWCCRRTRCFPGRSWRTSAGVIPKPRRPNVLRHARLPVPMNSLTAFLTDIRPASSVGEQMYPADRSAALYCPERC